MERKHGRYKKTGREKFCNIGIKNIEENLRDASQEQGKKCRARVVVPNVTDVIKKAKTPVGRACSEEPKRIN